MDSTMGKPRGLLRALLEEGRHEGLFALARLGGDPSSLDLDGLNLVTASALAHIAGANKLALVRRVGDLVPDEQYAELFARPFQALHPHKARELEAQGIFVSDEVAQAHAQEWDLYDLLFTALPLELGTDILAYALSRGLAPSPEDFSRLKSCAAGHGPHSPQEVDASFVQAMAWERRELGACMGK